MPKLKNVN
jgi:hypothetical protein